MDNKKQIEELTNKICSVLFIKSEQPNCSDCYFSDDCGYKILAEELLKYYQPKIPENNSVVLTQEEWATVHEQFSQAMYQKEVNTRKETAQKFAEIFKQRMKDKYQGSGIWWTEIVLMAIKICKEITEGKVNAKNE